MTQYLNLFNTWFKDVKPSKNNLDFFTRVVTIKDLILSSSFSKNDITETIKDISEKMIEIWVEEKNKADEHQDGIEFSEYKSSIICVKYGAGGEDAKDLAKIISDVYSKTFSSELWYEDCSFFFKINNKKEANKFFISECGIHKIIRLSPFTNKRQTSFISVRLIRIPKSTTAKINDSEIKVECFRSSGKGGQHANKTESAIRLTHITTGITVKIESTRSQGQNKMLAMDLIYAKIQEKSIQDIREKRIKKMKSEDKANWGSTPTKTWCLYPDQYIKYHENGFKIHNFGNIYDINIKKYIDLNIEHKLFGTIL